MEIKIFQKLRKIVVRRKKMLLIRKDIMKAQMKMRLILLI